MKAVDVVGRRITGIDQRMRFDAAGGRSIEIRGIRLDNGTRIYFTAVAQIEGETIIEAHVTDAPSVEEST